MQQDMNPAYTRHWQRQLYIRRLRVLVGGNVTKSTSFFFESDATNIGRVAATGSKTNGVSMYVQDAQVVHTLYARTFLHRRSASCRDLQERSAGCHDADGRQLR